MPMLSIGFIEFLAVILTVIGLSGILISFLEMSKKLFLITIPVTIIGLCCLTWSIKAENAPIRAENKYLVHVVTVKNFSPHYNEVDVIILPNNSVINLNQKFGCDFTEGDAVIITDPVLGPYYGLYYGRLNYLLTYGGNQEPEWDYRFLDNKRKFEERISHVEEGPF